MSDPDLPGLDAPPRDDGGPAFPLDADTGNCQFEKHGMALRDYFASHALCVLSVATLAKVATQRDLSLAATIAQGAYEIADAMLKARR